MSKKGELKIGIITPWGNIIFFHMTYEETALPKADCQTSPDFIKDMKQARDDINLVDQKSRLGLGA